MDEKDVLLQQAIEFLEGMKTREVENIEVAIEQYDKDGTKRLVIDVDFHYNGNVIVTKDNDIKYL